MLGHDPRVREDRHEVDVPVPAGDDVDVEVVLQGRAGTPTEVDPDVGAVGRKRPIEGIERSIDERPDLRPFVLLEVAGIGDVAGGGDQKVAVGVRVAVQEYDRPIAPCHHQPRPILVRVVQIAEEARERLRPAGPRQELEAPRGPETLHGRQPTDGRGARGTLPFVAPIPDLARLRDALTPVPAVAEPVDAAVAACLRTGPRGTEVLLCRRVERPGDPWSGHISFPGGRLETTDPDPLAAAARETREEVGFDPLAAGRLIGPLAPLVPRPPLVRLAAFALEVHENVELALNEEIATAWWTPFADLEPVAAQVAEVADPVPAWRLPFPDANDRVVWGITYRLLQGIVRLGALRDESTDLTETR